MKNLVAVNKVIMYSFNFEHEFVLKVWGEGSMGQHLKSKFLNLCERKSNTQSAFMYFYTELDGTNQELLVNYILLTYRG
jgi:hypothetical protein